MTVEFAISHRNIAFRTFDSWFMCSRKSDGGYCLASVAHANEPSQNQRA